MTEAEEAGVTLLGKHSNRVASRLQLTGAETLTLSNEVAGAGTLAQLLFVIKTNPLPHVTQGVAPPAVTALQGRGSVIELGEAEKHLLARGGSTHTLQLPPSLEKM